MVSGMLVRAHVCLHPPQIDDRTPLLAAVLAGSALRWFVQRGTGCEPLDLAPELPSSWLQHNLTLLRCHMRVQLDVFGVRVCASFVADCAVLAA
jgi:hypothetical protein